MRSRLLAAPFLTSLFAGVLTASPLTYTGGGLGGAVSVNANGNDATVFAGQLNVTLDGANRVAFCVDFFASLTRQTYDNATILYNTIPVTGARAQTLITATADPGSSVPEPSTYAMLALGGGLIALATIRGRKR